PGALRPHPLLELDQLDLQPQQFLLVHLARQLRRLLAAHARTLLTGGPGRTRTDPRPGAPGAVPPGRSPGRFPPRRLYGTPSSNSAYPAYEPDARAAVPRTVISEGRRRRRIARAGGMKRGNSGSR